MSTGFRVKNVKLHSGERLPLLIEDASGKPLWYPTLFVLTELRAINLASNTLLQVTRALMVCHQICNYLKVDLDKRFDSGRVLELREIDALVSLAGLTQKALDELVESTSEEHMPAKNRIRILSTERFRMEATDGQQELQVCPATKAIRLMYIRNYIAWRVRSKLLTLNRQHPSHQALVETGPVVVRCLSERIPPSSRHYDLNEREGLSKEVQARILEVTCPNSPENPWKNLHARVRNQLIVRWFIDLGLRKGEVLGTKVADVDLRSNEARIVRRADDPEELRQVAPHVKTKARLLAMDNNLADLTRTYVHGLRRQQRGARRHPYLFVATGTGNPLTLSAVSKLFIELRRKVPDMPEELCPHILRHTWNDRFSELMDERGETPEHEEKMRKQQMGWTDSSKMPSVYTRRHIRRKTNEVSLAMQSKSRIEAKEKI